MLREGPIPQVAHGALEYVIGLLLIAAPFLFGFDSALATGVSVTAGVVMLAIAATSSGPAGLVKTIPPTVHVVLDIILAIFFIAAPFVFAFRDETAPRNLFLILGVVLLLVTIGTRFRTTAAAPRGGSSKLG